MTTEIEAETATTSNVDVEARESGREWDQDLAPEVVRRIVQARWRGAAEPGGPAGV
ncbi:MAG TPA: hypothetical protein VF158_16210 [Longimicrobiales bacterium]